MGSNDDLLYIVIYLYIYIVFCRYKTGVFFVVPFTLKKSVLFQLVKRSPYFPSKVYAVLLYK